jgi:hypothetical protein
VPLTANSGAVLAWDIDPLSTSALGTAIAGAGSLVWPDLVAGTISLAAVASFVVWIRALRAVRRRQLTGYRVRRLLPCLATGGAGWATALALGPVSLTDRALVLGATSVALWLLARSGVVGI